MTYEEMLIEFQMPTQEFDDVEDVKSFGLLIDAIKKQIPRKPIKSHESIIKYCEAWKCPNCGFEFSGGTIDYCYKCGQAIDKEVAG